MTYTSNRLGLSRHLYKRRVRTGLATALVLPVGTESYHADEDSRRLY